MALLAILLSVMERKHIQFHTTNPLRSPNIKIGCIFHSINLMDGNRISQIILEHPFELQIAILHLSPALGLIAEEDSRWRTLEELEAEAVEGQQQVEAVYS